MQRTLRCRNEPVELGARLGKALTASVQQWRACGSQRITSGRVGTCARDQVGECRRCGDAVCRNCVMKPPSARDIKGRHRRLCRTCMKCPIQRLTVTNAVVADDEHESLPTRYSREPCACEHQGVWICEPCGQLLRSANTTYLRGWAWRARYSACGGVGAGLGEGNEGVECGRGSNCLDARIIVNEIECDADELAAHEGLIESAADGGCRHHWAGNSYNTHEIVGLGGKVKKKIKKKVRVGAIVKEYEDERVAGKVLRREQDGANRSWCGWCLRVVVGKKDVEQASGSSDSVDSVDSLSTL
ncbi:hypothetical protein BDY17DRAFT_165384 [Neohortaea acidophila]|uniref:Uncharacterized protein n=1 Tax=Neohortaea acidophila TaxID=245834 RepID=A0A6A6PRM7_9PEZI|nr:uncharacterized protein BDY17DRAFT_165384 [Neohortaea acidophila]KAF2482739.1 hypothetical protein BDY17DRAFT_165384 [Neohortaea acidophila]